MNDPPLPRGLSFSPHGGRKEEGGKMRYEILGNEVSAIEALHHE